MRPRLPRVVLGAVLLSLAISCVTPPDVDRALNGVARETDPPTERGEPAPPNVEQPPEEAPPAADAPPDGSSAVPAETPDAPRAAPVPSEDAPTLPAGWTPIGGEVATAWGRLAVAERADSVAAILMRPEPLITPLAPPGSIVAGSVAPHSTVGVITLAIDGGGGAREVVVIHATPAGVATRRFEEGAMRRTAMRDLDGDGRPELVSHSSMFDTGRRELIVEAYVISDGGIEPAASLPVVRRVNERLEELRNALAEPPSAAWTRALTIALEPIEGAGPATAHIPTREVIIPEIVELRLPLGEPSWSFAHELAIGPLREIYRVRIDIAANPFASRPIAIRGLDDGR